MGQGEILALLKEKYPIWMTSKFISAKMKITQGSTSANLRRLIKSGSVEVESAFANNRCGLTPIYRYKIITED